MGFDHDLRNGTLPLKEKRTTNVVTGSPVQIPDQGAFWAICVDLQSENWEAGTVLIDLKVITIRRV